MEGAWSTIRMPSPTVLDPNRIQFIPDHWAIDVWHIKVVNDLTGWPLQVNPAWDARVTVTVRQKYRSGPDAWEWHLTAYRDDGHELDTTPRQVPTVDAAFDAARHAYIAYETITIDSIDDWRPRDHRYAMAVWPPDHVRAFTVMAGEPDLPLLVARMQHRKHRDPAWRTSVRTGRDWNSPTVRWEWDEYEFNDRLRVLALDEYLTGRRVHVPHGVSLTYTRNW